MELGLTGKVAMVAAASKGIGLATARALAAEGCRVSICARNENALQAVCREFGAQGYVADVGKAADLQSWFERTASDLGPPAILVTNTGGPPAGPIDQTTDEQWQAGFDSTVMNVVRMVRIAAPVMAESGWGRIVHITSLVAKEPSPMLPISSTLRAGLMALTRLQAAHYASAGITVNSVLPGHTMTDRQTHLAELRAKEEGTTIEAALERQAQLVPMKRLARADEVANAIVFLCSKQGAYITGTNLLVDGGIVRGLA